MMSGWSGCRIEMNFGAYSRDQIIELVAEKTGHILIVYFVIYVCSNTS